MTTKEQVWTYECPCCYASYEPAECPESGRCGKCDDAPNLREKQSEFGAGIVVCLVKFSEHVWNRDWDRIWKYHHWTKKRVGESPEQFSEESFDRWPSLRAGATNAQEHALNECIHMWASGAGDHFYDLDEERAPQELRDLASLVLELRNQHLTDTPRLFTIEDVNRVVELQKEATLAIDRMLGTVPNWGEW